MANVNTWDCCRTCLRMESLHAIFAKPELCEKYTNLLEIVAGVKIEINDSLPQLICSNCIEFVNQSKRFRKRCEDAFKLLTEHKLDSTKLIQLQMLKHEETAMQIDITEQSDEEFKDFDDNVTLDTLQSNSEDDKCEIDKEISKEFVKQPESTNLTTTRGKKKTVGVKPERIKQAKEPKRRRVTKKEKSGEKKEKIECEYCHKVLTSKLSLRNHYKIHTGFDVVCEHCGKKFITRRLLLMHCRAKHGYEKTDKCSYCDYRASNAEQVKIHERLHTGEKPFVCEECGSGFHRKSSYLQHVAIHLPEKTVQCVQCPALFKSLTLMRIHLQRHRAPRYLFRCGACSATFARRRNVARHLQRVHSLQPDQGNIERLHLH